MGVNNITLLPSALSQLSSSLTILSLHENSLTSGNNNLAPIFGLAQLTALNLRDNDISELGDQLGNLTNLAALNVSHNRLTSLPSSLSSLSSLSRLQLRNNRLTSVSLTGLTDKLIEFDCRSNQLQSIAEGLYHATQLETLNLSNNMINSEISENIQNLKALTSLNLSLNKITAVPATIGMILRITAAMWYRNFFCVFLFEEDKSYNSDNNKSGTTLTIAFSTLLYFLFFFAQATSHI